MAILGCLGCVGAGPTTVSEGCVADSECARDEQCVAGACQLADAGAALDGGGPQADCTPASVGAGHYLFCAGRRTWEAARDTCSGQGGELVVLDDNGAPAANAAEDDALLEAASARGIAEYWIGLTDAALEGRFVWLDGSVLADASFGGSRFAAREPDEIVSEDCVEVRLDGLWNDESCRSIRGAVCEALGPTAANPPADCAAVVVNAQTYFFCSARRNIVVARAVCTQLNATLVNFADHPLAADNEAERVAVNTRAAQRIAAPYWIGLTDQGHEGSFVWPNGRVLNLDPAAGESHFGEGEPSNTSRDDGEDCVEVAPDGTWNDLICTIGLPMVCERVTAGPAIPADCSLVTINGGSDMFCAGILQLHYYQQHQ